MMNIRQTLREHFQARTAVVRVVGYDEAWVIRELTVMTGEEDWSPDMGLYSWDLADQFVCHKQAAQAYDIAREATVDTVLKLIDEYKGSATFVLKDAHMIWEQKKTPIRKLRNLAQRLPSVTPRKNLVLLTPEWAAPAELKHDLVSLECPKPTRETMDGILRRVAGNTQALTGVRPELLVKIEDSALGLSAVQAERVFRGAIVRGGKGRLNEECLDSVREEKRAVIRESGALELYPFTDTEDNVGGLETLKDWLAQRREAFTDDARDYGLDVPAGLILVGIPGTGKSLCARVTAGLWRLPLLRLDMGAVFGGLLGASEKNIREAIAISELIAPCILWVDEIEKAFGGSGGDSGTASRVLGTFLTWMAEKKSPVFVFATANDVYRLPMEFLRKGRFDEVFFLDLPTEEERRAILSVHLRKRGYGMPGQRFDLGGLARATTGFVGSELEAVVKEAMFPAFMDGRREITNEDLLKAAGQMVPLARSHAQLIDNLRSMVSDGLARNASKVRSEDAVACERIRAGRLLDV
jgi:hypothetical protein